MVQRVLWLNVQLHPNFNIPQHVDSFAALGIPLKRDFVGRIFRSWGWSWKKPSHTQILKYTPANIHYELGRRVQGLAPVASAPCSWSLSAPA